MLDALVFSERDKYGVENIHAGKVICLKPGFSSWSACERGEEASNLCVVRISGAPADLVAEVEARGGLKVYPFALWSEGHGAGSVLEEISVRWIPAEQLVPGGVVEFSEMDGG